VSGLIWGRLLLLKSKYHSVPAVGSAAAIINHLLPQFKRRRLLRGIAILVVALILGGLAAAEFKASYLGAQFLARVAHKLSFSIEPGPNSSLRFPQQGPYESVWVIPSYQIL